MADPATVARPDLTEAQREVERAARRYAAFSHGNLGGSRYREREEARDDLLDALARLDAARRRVA